MRAAVAYPDGGVQIRDAWLDDPRADEVRVRVEACGICATDLEARHLVELPAVFGHEGVGVVEEVGREVQAVRVGDRVIVSYPWCGACPHCCGDRPFHCDDIVRLKFAGSRADGSRPISVDGRAVASAFFQQSTFATHANVPARDLVVVDSNLPCELLAALPCGVLTGAGTVANVLQVKRQDALLVAGVGAVGLAAVMTARRLGVRSIVAIDIHPSRRSLASELGAHHALDGRAADLPAQLRAIEPRGFDAVLDTTGRAPVIATLIEHLTMGARLALVTTPPPTAAPVFPLESLFYRAATLCSVIVGLAVPQRFLPQLLEWYRAGEFPVDRLVQPFPFEQIEAAFAAMASGAVVKPVLTMA